ncbi:PPOX class F420-dependent oxidoreductase [Kitasatospora camelliae]|uniref:PPOX class F420-dependent oxidoreductase n=1 Tax=Kitasatospora camelliae TaxID=3156397 RepID=A0AAU8JSB8_9ACTN
MTGRTRAADELADTRYLLLTTFEEDGTPAATATWVVPDGPAALGVWAPADSAAVRRVRARPGVLVSRCDAYGRAVGGRLPARAAVCDPQDTARYRTELIHKYGLTALLTLARSRIRLGLDGTVGIRITLAAPDRLRFGRSWQPSPWYSPN